MLKGEYMKKEKSCGIIVINDNKVLMVNQKNGVYSFPKGHVEENESEIDTALREVKEETNIDAKITSDKRYVVNYITDKGINKTVVFFLGKAISFDIAKQESEIEEANWVDIEHVYDTISYDNMKELWKNVLEEIK